MLGQAKKYFTLIAQSADRAEVEQMASTYEKAHPGVHVIIDQLKTYFDPTEKVGLWRARAWITIKRSLWQHFLYTCRR